jgi:hypothetical protein
MTNYEAEGGSTRDDLVQRVELMESMIAEGRRFTTRCGWIFTLWGFVGLAATGLLFFLPPSKLVGEWTWPVCLVAGVVLTFVGMALQARETSCGESTRGRSVKAVWGMMGVTLAIYISSAMMRHYAWQYSYIAALLMIVGMAHAISAVILRWRAQGIVAAIWWMGAIAVFSARSYRDVQLIMFLEMGLGMTLFGLYAMMLNRSNDGGRGRKNA